MKQKKFDIGESVGFGWDTLKANLGFLILVLLIVWAVEAVFSIPDYFAARSAGPIFIFNILSFIIGIFISIVLIKISLRYTYSEVPDFTDLYTGYPYFLNMLFGSILYALIVIGGLILLIVPGIIWGLKYQFFGYLIIDQDMDAVEAIKKSGKITMGEKGHLFLFALAGIGINLLGALACGIGLFASIPTVFVAHAHIYRKLAYAASAGQAPMTAPAPTMPPTPPGV
jgi:uncharacterized membrane protein